ncbi:hypothetical protein RJ639_023647 [Escallonia herrerae]|uniref:Uncharacterized protein n=1 Tax=Escallonia herrerae TaxID=1293975 RepID=A0AA88V314_9ASTE|nr:hypothetical protein RJ639_023647 [Escallonia herrerae]
MGSDNWSVLGRLRTAVKKVTCLLNFNLNRWRLASIIGASSSKRRLSFNDRPGLTAACTDDTGLNEDTGSAHSLQRTVSCPSEDDIDKRADLFISNFYRQLRIERQVSLELRSGEGRSEKIKLISPSTRKPLRTTR